jgi:hypothetical protein
MKFSWIGRMLNNFSKDHPCRCGYAGEGVHQCHAGRNPQYPAPHSWYTEGIMKDGKLVSIK